jgi:hypothetical protein
MNDTRYYLIYRKIPNVIQPIIYYTSLDNGEEMSYERFLRCSIFEIPKNQLIFRELDQELYEILTNQANYTEYRYLWTKDINGEDY